MALHGLSDVTLHTVTSEIWGAQATLASMEGRRAFAAMQAHARMFERRQTLMPRLPAALMAQTTTPHKAPSLYRFGRPEATLKHAFALSFAPPSPLSLTPAIWTEPNSTA